MTGTKKIESVQLIQLVQLVQLFQLVQCSASVSVVVSDLSSPRCKVRCTLLVDNVLPQLELSVLN